jgi:hypothetical protein
VNLAHQQVTGGLPTKSAGLPQRRPHRELNIYAIDDHHHLADDCLDMVRIRTDVLRKPLRDLGQAYAKLGNEEGTV